MATTTNYSWTTPDDTALVKDGAAAIRSLGTAIDTTVFNNASAGIAKTIVDAKGDIIAATAADTVSRLAVGANDTVLTADSTTATGLKWSAPAGVQDYALLNAGGTAMSGSSTVSVTGISGKKFIFIRIDGASEGANDGFRIRLNADSAANYFFTDSSNLYYNAQSQIKIDTSSALSYRVYINLFGCGTSTIKPFSWGFSRSDVSAYGIGDGFYNSSSAISSVDISCVTGNFDAGTLYVYGA